jgi:FeS assembly SUF system protein
MSNAPLTPERIEEIRKLVVESLKTVYDPEIPVDIYELGLVYDIDISPEGRVEIRMTLTSPGCPVAESLPREVELKTAAIEGVSEVRIELVWDPPWTPDRMSEAARLELNL